MFPPRRKPANRKAAPVVAPTLPATPAAPVIATAPAIVKEFRMPTTVSTLGEKDTQALWFRLKMAAGVSSPGRKVPIFHLSRNVNPDLTNLEMASQMPNTGSFKVAGLEIRANPNCGAGALKAFIAHTCLRASIGAKGFEKLNQPSVMFPSLAATGAASNFSTSDAKGVYTFNRGEEINLQESQTFDIRFEADSEGFEIPVGEVLDIIVSLKGQKTSRLAL